MSKSKKKKKNQLKGFRLQSPDFNLLDSLLASSKNRSTGADPMPTTERGARFFPFPKTEMHSYPGLIEELNLKIEGWKSKYERLNAEIREREEVNAKLREEIKQQEIEISHLKATNQDLAQKAIQVPSTTELKVDHGHTVDSFIYSMLMRVMAYHDELTEKLEQENQELKNQIGIACTPDEQGPRGDSWHDERRKRDQLIKELEEAAKTREVEIFNLRAKISAFDQALASNVLDSIPTIYRQTETDPGKATHKTFDAFKMIARYLKNNQSTYDQWINRIEKVLENLPPAELHTFKIAAHRVLDTIIKELSE